MVAAKISRLDFEKQFHDAKATTPGKSGLIYRLSILVEADRCAYRMLGDLAGKTVLEIGCGTGENAVKLAADRKA